jgi:hypothetical protein
MLDAVNVLRQHPLRGASIAAPAARPQSHLQPGGDSAYQLTPIV